MISEQEALDRILKTVRTLPPRTVPLANGLDRFSAEDFFAKLSLPRFDNSAMDGYAIVAKSAAKEMRLRVVGEQAAGIDRGLRVQAGDAIRIFTGAPIPAGADAVVMQEDVRAENDWIEIQELVSEGDFIRRRGSDLSEGQKILSAGERITPQMLALLASQGFAEIKIGGEVRAAILSTGDELVGPNATLRPGQIYESNATLIRGLLEKCGALVESSERTGDELIAVEKAMRRGIEKDVLVITGGVSVGARDVVKEALRAVGAEIDLWRVAIKPGKPFLFGRVGNCAIFGLPGNPVSAFVTFLAFVRPALLRMMNASDNELALTSAPAELSNEVENESDRVLYLRGLFRAGKFAPIGRQESHALYGLSRANSLLRLNPGERLQAGAACLVQLFPS